MTTMMATTHTKDTQAAVTPEDALRFLREGNERFLNGNTIERPWLEQIRTTAEGQYPFAVVLGCIDSRVPVEAVFDQGIGDVFTARVAGNVINADILGSMEFACKLAGAKAIVIMGHTACGAVKGAIANAQMGNLTELVSKIAPAVNTARAEDPAEGEGFVDRVVEINIGGVLRQIRERSAVLAQMERDGEIALVGAMYDVATGEVRFLDA
ncbi:MAG: carbonic anhydrase family protein [Gemmatimonadota bacterium]